MAVARHAEDLLEQAVRQVAFRAELAFRAEAKVSRLLDAARVGLEEPPPEILQQRVSLVLERRWLDRSSEVTVEASPF